MSDQTARTGQTSDRRQRLRADWIAGAEEEWLRQTGKPMTTTELKRVLRRYPGD